MKIKIVEAGWAGFSGQLGWVQFQDGVSVEEVSHADAQQLAAVVQVEELREDGESTGKSPSMAQVILDTHGKQMTQAASAMADQSPVVPAAPAKVYSEAELAAIADAKGIVGLREVGDPMGLKGKSIAELIGKILTFQAEVAAKVAAAAPAAPAAGAAPQEPQEPSVPPAA